MSSLNQIPLRIYIPPPCGTTWCEIVRISIIVIYTRIRRVSLANRWLIVYCILSGEMRARWSFILLLLVIVQATTGQAPGDEDERCVEDVTVVNEEVLMSSFNYRNVVPRNGGPWTVVDDDDNNDNLMFSSLTTVSEILF